MPSSYPFPSVAALALSLYSSARRVEPLPTVVEFSPYQLVTLAVTFPSALPEGL